MTRLGLITTAVGFACYCSPWLPCVLFGTACLVLGPTAIMVAISTPQEEES